MKNLNFDEASTNAVPPEQKPNTLTLPETHVVKSLCCYHYVTSEKLFFSIVLKGHSFVLQPNFWIGHGLYNLEPDVKWDGFS